VRNSSLIAIEEPENGVHPHLSEYLTEVLKSASQRSQIVVTTHAPDLLDYLEPHQVILCDKEDGFTKLKRASSVSDIEQFRKHFSLGELWSQGAIGAMP
jgi:predicted ATPase